jgi:hypothetical protein
MKRIIPIVAAMVALLGVNAAQAKDLKRIPLWPLVGYESGDDGTTIALLISCFTWEKQKTPPRIQHVWIGTPEVVPVRWALFTHDNRDGVRKLDVIWPVFAWYQRDEPRPSRLLRLWVVTPLAFLYDHSDPERREQGHRTLAIATVFQDRRSSTSATPWRHSQGLFPIYWWDHDARGGQILCIHPYLILHERNWDGGTHTTLLDPFCLLGQTKGQDRRVSLFARVFDYRQRPNGERQFNFVWRLLAYEEHDGRRWFRLLFSPRIPLGQM